MTARKPNTPSLKDLMKENKEVDPAIEENTVDNAVDANNATDNTMDETGTPKLTDRAPVVGNDDPVLVDDETYANPAPGHTAPTNEVVKSSGPDNSDSNDYVTTESGVTVVRENYDNSGNGVTDNKPNDWDDTNPSGAVSFQTPSDNASTRHSVVTTEYANPNAVDDKGLAGNPDPETDGVTEIKEAVDGENDLGLEEADTSMGDKNDEDNV